MDESTTGEPLGRSDSLNDAGAPIGVQGPREKPGPIGGNTPPQPSQTNPAAATTQELNLVGNFPKPASWTAKKELDQIHADKWFPSTLDFLAVAGKGSVAVANTWDFCLQIVKAPKKISRLNFFSHGTGSLIALQGEILDDGSNVMLATIPDAGWTPVLFPKAILDPFAQKWGDIGQNSGSVSLTLNGTSFTLDDVRKKFARRRDNLALPLPRRLRPESLPRGRQHVPGYSQRLYPRARLLRPLQFPNQPAAQGRRRHHAQTGRFLRKRRHRLQEARHERQRSNGSASKALTALLTGDRLLRTE
jgi:hypothetical protein